MSQSSPIEHADKAVSLGIGFVLLSSILFAPLSQTATKYLAGDFPLSDRVLSGCRADRVDAGVLLASSWLAYVQECASFLAVRPLNTAFCVIPLLDQRSGQGTAGNGCINQLHCANIGGTALNSTAG